MTLSHPTVKIDLLAALLAKARAIIRNECRVGLTALHVDSQKIIKTCLPHGKYGTLNSKFILCQGQFGDRAEADAKSLKGQPFHY